MTPAEEAQLLKVVLARLQDNRYGERKARWLLIGTWLGLVAAFAILFQLAPLHGRVKYVIAGIGAIIGILASFSYIHAHSLKQWPVLARYVDTEGVMRRLNELTPNTSFERTREK